MPRIRQTVRGALLVAVAASSLALAAPSWGATTFTVTSTADSPDANLADPACVSVAGGCTIRAAIEQADTVSGPDRIEIPPGTYESTFGFLQPDTAMDIVGTAGARDTTLDADGSTSGFIINGLGPISISGLSITGVGGAGSPVYVNGPEVGLNGVFIHHNANLSFGGGVRMDSGSVNIVRSAITDNTVTIANSASGGGVYMQGGNAVIESTTISRNKATATGVGSTSFGGGVLASGGTLVMRHVTLTDNALSAGSAGTNGGNMYVNTDAVIADLIITGGSSVSNPDCSRPAASPFTAGGKNILGSAAGGCPFPAGTVVAANASLGPLGDNGGVNGWTAVPSVGGAAIDAAGACPLNGIDQRGNPAPAGAGCDIGAAELGADLQLSLTASAASVAAGGQLTYFAKVVNAGVDHALSSRLDVNPPSGSTVLLVAPSQGTCAGTACNLGTVAAGGSASVTVVVSAPAAGTLQATASASSAIPDPTPANASAGSAVTAVVPATTPTIPIVNPPPLAKDTTKPVLSAFGLKGPLKAGKSGRLRMTLSEAANVTITVQSLTPGRRVKGKCDPKGKSGARCTIVKAVGSLTVALPAGARLFTLPAKIGKATLKAGRYRLTATAKDAAGNSSKALATDVTVAGATKKPKK